MKHPEDEAVDSIHNGDMTPIDFEDATHAKNSYLGSTQLHPFTSPADAAYWSNVYERPLMKAAIGLIHSFTETRARKETAPQSMS